MVKCPHCGGGSFGLQLIDPTSAQYKLNLVKCNGCGAPVGAMSFYDTGTQLKNFLTALGDAGLTFGVAIDVNSTSAKSEVLTQFRLLDLDQSGDGPLGSLVLFSILNPVPLPDIRNGNGSADYLITGFNLSGLANLGDRLLFQATWSGAVDGGESFYIVPAVVPIPPAIALFGAGLAGLGLLTRRRKDKKLDVAAA